MTMPCLKKFPSCYLKNTTIGDIMSQVKMVYFVKTRLNKNVCSIVLGSGSRCRVRGRGVAEEREKEIHLPNIYISRRSSTCKISSILCAAKWSNNFPCVATQWRLSLKVTLYRYVQINKRQMINLSDTAVSL